MHKPKHLIRGLFAHMDLHQKVFTIHTVILLVLLLTLPVVSLEIIQSSIGDTTTFKFFNWNFWKSNIIVLCMMATVFMMTFHSKARQLITAAFGVTDVFINFVCYFVIVAVYIGIGDSILTVHNNLTQTIGLSGGYYIIGIWLAIGLLLHASWTYKYGKQAHQSTIINLSSQAVRTSSQQRKF